MVRDFLDKIKTGETVMRVLVGVLCFSFGMGVAWSRIESRVSSMEKKFGTVETMQIDIAIIKTKLENIEKMMERQ
jgi:hypothetical protein